MELEKTIYINAPAETVFTFVINMQGYTNWFIKLCTGGKTIGKMGIGQSMCVFNLAYFVYACK